MNLVRLVKMKIISGELDDINDIQRRIINIIVKFELHNHIFNYQFYYIRYKSPVNEDIIYLEYNGQDNVFIFRYHPWFVYTDIFNGYEFDYICDSIQRLMVNKLKLNFKISLLN